jgi:hypothetical protein
LSVGIFEVDSTLRCPFLSDSFDGDAVLNGSLNFSFCLGERKVPPFEYWCEFGLIGILEGDGTRGAELNFSEVSFICDSGCIGCSSSRLVASKRLLRSDNELRRFFFGALTVTSCPGSPIVSSLFELVGRLKASSNAPAIGGLSFDVGRRSLLVPNDIPTSTDFVLVTEALDRLAESPVAGCLACLLRLRQTEGRVSESVLESILESFLLFWRISKLSKAHFFLMEDVFDVTEPV